MRVSETSTLWTKAGNCSGIQFLKKEVIIFGTGCHMIFINLNTGEEHIYTANSSSSGDGVQCYNGHRTQNIFAFAENCTHPRIFLKTYPNFENICTFKDSVMNGFCFIIFSETSLLVTLGELPIYELTVWNWRTGEKIANQPTGLYHPNQILRCNLGSPVFCTQLAKETTMLYLWDIFLCHKKCILTQHAIQPPPECKPLIKTFWTTEGALFAIDIEGSIYTMLPDHRLEKVISVEQPSDGTLLPTSFCWYKSGIMVTGPTKELRYYKKSGSWSMTWTMRLETPIVNLLACFDCCIGITSRQDIFQIYQTESELKPIKVQQNNFNDLCILYPTGEYVITLCHQDTLNICEITTGNLIDSMDLQGIALAMEANPKFPYVAVGFQDGNLQLISAYEPHKLTKLCSFYLCEEAINSVYFNECGTIFVAANLTLGLFFIMEGLPGSTMEVIASVDAQVQIANYMLVISHDCYRLFAIPVTSDKYIAGDKIIRFCVIKGKTTNIREYNFGDENKLFVKLCATGKPTRDRIFYGITHTSKALCEIEIKKGFDLGIITQTIPTGHQMLNVNVYLNKDFFLSWSYDGFVILRSANFEERIGMGLPHHRTYRGVRKARVGPYGKYIVSLGYDDMLVCTNIKERPIPEELHTELTKLLTSPTYQLLFSQRTVGYSPKGAMAGKCYLEVQKLKNIELEKIHCKTERKSILKEFASIQRKLQKLVNFNIEGPENEHLDLQEFNLDIQLFNAKTAEHMKLVKATEIYLKKLIVAQDKVSNYIIEHYWNSAALIGTSIKAIFANYSVANYVLLPEIMKLNALITWLMNHKILAAYLNGNDSFKPWVNIPEGELRELLACRPAVTKVRIVQNIDEGEDEEVLEIPEDIETKIAFFGSDLPRFVDIPVNDNLQYELFTYLQCEFERMYSKSTSYKAKIFFNKKFDAIMAYKQKDMSTVKERNARLRHIISEINYFSVDKIDITIDDPEWEQVEIPELIKIVKDEEVPVTPYISPSEQSLLNAQAAEAERIRLLLLADDFRERALMAMMNGVLEVRWEDELKKEVPLPKCMLEKEPEHFNEEDLRTVRDYEIKVAFLQSERERYKNLLDGEYQKVANFVRENIRKFNSKLHELFVLKLDVDAAVSQESLKVNKNQLFQFTRFQMRIKEAEIIKKMEENEKAVITLQKLISSLHESIIDCRGLVESVQLKEKFLDRAFKKDFQDHSIVVQEQAQKLYKKRPKTNYRSQTSSSTLNEFAKCIISNHQSLLLPSECHEYIKSLEMLDLYVGVPPAVDESAYALVVKHRRLRIEFEIKLKGVTQKLQESETTISTLNKRLSEKKEHSVQLSAQLSQHRQDIIKYERNREIQIVLPQGLVELPLTGSFEDFKDALLMSRQDIEDINKVILEYGNRKLTTLRRTMGFHRRILASEWNHKRLRMLIQDLQEKITDIQGVKLTKEMQSFLKTKDKGKFVPFETEIEMIRASYENTIQERKDQVDKMKRQIHGIMEQNKLIERNVTAVNVDVCEYNINKDHAMDEKERSVIDARTKLLLQRSSLVEKIQQNHQEILVLQTELELLRLRTYPTLKYQIFNYK